MRGLSYRTSKDYIAYDPLQKCNYRILNGKRIWLQPKPKEVYLSKSELDSGQLHISL